MSSVISYFITELLAGEFSGMLVFKSDNYKVIQAHINFYKNRT